MPSTSRYSPLEPFPADTSALLPNALKVPTSGAIDYKAMLIRLLCGTLDFKNNQNNRIYKQRENYTKLVHKKNSRLSRETIRSSLSSSTIKPKFSSIDRYLQESFPNNSKFYRELFFEFCDYFVCLSTKNYVNCFLHLYRILESIALCFPLIWTSKSRDYEKSYDELKGYFSNPKSGERNIFQRFTSDVLPGDLLQTSITLQINSQNDQWKECYFNTLIEKDNKDMQVIDPKNIISKTPFEKIEINAGALIDLTISIRDKYFHFLTGKGKSFNSENLPDPQEFFMIINEPIANWFSVILFEVIIHEMEQ